MSTVRYIESPRDAYGNLQSGQSPTWEFFRQTSDATDLSSYAPTITEIGSTGRYYWDIDFATLNNGDAVGHVTAEIDWGSIFGTARRYQTVRMSSTDYDGWDEAPEITIQLYETGTTTPITDAYVQVWHQTAELPLSPALTPDANGQVTVGVPAGTYRLVPRLDSEIEWQSTPWTFTVTGEATFTFYGTVGATTVVPEGGLTLHDMLSELRLIARKKWPEDDRLLTPSILKAWLNAAYQELDRKLRWTRCTYQFTTTDGEDQYIIPSHVREWLMVRYHDNGTLTQLEHLSLEEWGSKWIDESATAKPTHFVHHGDKLHLYPVPNTDGDTVTMFGAMEPPNLEGDEDKPGFPAHLHRYVVQLALAEAYKFMEHPSEGMAIEGFVDKQVVGERREAAMQRGSSRGIIHEGV